MQERKNDEEVITGIFKCRRKPGHEGFLRVFVKILWIRSTVAVVQQAR